jgi:hypothetical protein
MACTRRVLFIAGTLQRLFAADKRPTAQQLVVRLAPVHALPRCFFAISLVLLGTLSACGGTVDVTGRWRDPTQTARFTNVLVVGVAQRDLYRRLYEDDFVRQFAAHGVSATPSYLSLPGDAPTREQLEEAVAKQHCDGVLITHMVNIENRRQYKEGPMNAQFTLTGYGYGYYGGPYYSPMYGGYGSYYSGVYSYTHAEGYYETTKTFHLETTLYSVASGKLVWALLSQTVDPDNITKVIHSLSEAVFGSLVEENLLPPKQ